MQDRIDAVWRQIQALKARVVEERARLRTGDMGSLGPRPSPTLRKSLREPSLCLGHHSGKVTSLWWAASGCQVLVASQDGRLTLWNVGAPGGGSGSGASGRAGAGAGAAGAGAATPMVGLGTPTRATTFQLRSAWVMSVCLDGSPTPRFAASGGVDNLCSIHEISGSSSHRVSLRELSAHDGYISCCRFVGDERQVLTSSGDSTCILWDVERSTPVVHFNDHAGDVLSVAICPVNQSLFVSGSSDATAKLWDIRLGRCTATYAEALSDVTCAAFAPGGTVFGTSSDDGSCRLQDARCPHMLSQFHSPEMVCGVPTLDFSESGRFLFSGHEDSRLLVWDVTAPSPSTSPLRVLGRHTNRVTCVQVSPTGSSIASGSWDTDVLVWA